MNEYVVKLVVDSKGAVVGLKNAQGAAVDLDRTLGKTGEGAGRFSRVMDVALGVGLQDMAMQAIRSIAGIAVEMARLGADLGETQSKYETVFGTATDAMESMRQEWAAIAGLSDGQFKGLAADVGAVVKGFGMTGPALAGFSQDVLKVAGDLQSFHNVPIEETFQALRSGLTGEAEPLKRFGIILYEAEVKQRALIEAQRLGVAASDQQALAAARLALITEKAGVAIGDLERTQDSASNKARRVGAELQNLRETLASSLVPAYGLVVEAMADVVDGSGGLAGVLKATLGKAVFEAVAQLLRFVDAGYGIVKALGTTVQSMGLTGGASQLLERIFGELYRMAKFVETGLYGVAVVMGTVRGAWASLTGNQQAYADAAADVNRAIEGGTAALDQARTGASRFDGVIQSAARGLDAAASAAGALTTETQAATQATQASTQATQAGTAASERSTRSRRGERTAFDELRGSVAKLTADYQNLARAGWEVGRLDATADLVRRRTDLVRAQAQIIALMGQPNGNAPWLTDLARQIGQVERQAAEAEAQVKALRALAAGDTATLEPNRQAGQAAADAFYDAWARRLAERLRVPFTPQFRQQIERDAAELGVSAAAMLAGAVETFVPADLPVSVKLTGTEKALVWLKEAGDAVAEWASEIQQGLGLVGDLFGQMHAARVQQIDEEARRETDAIDRALAGHTLSATERKRLEEQKRAVEERAEKARRKAAREQAILEKAIALAQVAIQTAVNTAEAFPNPWKMAAAVALGALQAAVVAKTPIPAANRGGLVPGSGPDRDSTLMYLTPGEAVVTRRSVGPNADLIAAMNARPGQRVAPSAGGSAADLAPVVAAVDRVAARLDALDLRADYDGIRVGMARDAARTDHVRRL